jgi:hypothetical protein
LRPYVRYFGREGQEIVIEEDRYITKKSASVNEKDVMESRQLTYAGDL